VIRRAALATATVVMVAGPLVLMHPARADEQLSGEWSGSHVQRPAAVSGPPYQTGINGAFRRDRPYAQPTISVAVAPPDRLPSACPQDWTVTPPSVHAEAPPPGELFSRGYGFSSTVQMGSQTCNGIYDVRVVADVAGSPDPVLTTVILAAVPPAPVGGVTASPADGRAVKVEWVAPVDPPADFLGYYIERTSASGAKGIIASPSRSATSYIDYDPPAEGGETTYRVIARRSAPGGELMSSGGDGATVPVDPVPVDPGTPTDPDDPSDPGDPGSPGSPSAPPSSQPGGAGVRPPLLGNSSGGFLPQLLTPGPPTTIDTGYAEELPFEPEQGGEDPVLPDDELASLLYEGEPGRGLAIPAATALVLALWAFHLRFLARLSRPD